MANATTQGLSFFPQKASYKTFINTPLELNPKIIWPAKRPKPCEAPITGLLGRVKLGTMWKFAESGKSMVLGKHTFVMSSKTWPGTKDMRVYMGRTREQALLRLGEHFSLD